MKRFLHASDIGDIKKALEDAANVKANPFADQALGKNRTAIFIFFNNSLRTRLSSQRAAYNLGLNPIVLNVGQDSWKLEGGKGVIMDGDKAEHLLEAIPVIGTYCDIIGVRSFAGLRDRDYDYAETVLNEFIKYSGKPVISLESATVHPCQAFADLITINEHFPLYPDSAGIPASGQKSSGSRGGGRPKVVLSWAPHPGTLPQAVPNSFAEWMNAAPVDFVVACPEEYELAPEFVGKARVEHDQMKAFEGADFIYAKNWSAYKDYGKNLCLKGRLAGGGGHCDFGEYASWTVGTRQMAVTNDARFMHCLPVRRNVVVSDEVIDSPRSLVISEAANRVVSIQTVMKRILEEL